MSLQANDCRRAHPRLSLNEGVQAELRLLDRHGKLLSGGISLIQVINLSQEGLCFWSNIQLPVQPNYLVDVRMTIDGLPIAVRGSVRWHKEKDSGYLHGLSFSSSGLLRSLLVRIMNRELLTRQPQQRKAHQTYQTYQRLMPVRDLSFIYSLQLR